MKKNRKFEIFVEDYNVPLGPWYILHDQVFTKNLSEMTSGKIKLDALFVYKKDYVIWGTDAKQFLKGGEYFQNKLKNEKNYSETVIRNHYKVIKEIKALVKELKTSDFSAKTGKQLLALYEQYYHLYARAWAWALVIQFLDMGQKKYSDQVKMKLANKFTRSENTEIGFSKLISPLKPNYISLEFDSVLAALESIQLRKGDLKNLQKSAGIADLPQNIRVKMEILAKKYGWLQYYYLGPAAGSSYYYDLLKNKLTINAKNEILVRKKDRSELQKFQKNIEKKLDPGELSDVKMLREFLHLKETRKEFQSYILSYAMDKWYKEVARRLMISPVQAHYILKSEFIRFLKKGKKDKVDTDVLNERIQYCAYLLKDGKNYLVTGKEAKVLEDRYMQKETKKFTNELMGTVAFPGKAKGKVKIVNSTKDLSKFKKGDILVSFSTNPSLVPAMNKAAAIITNTGGITSHAAIVSRELKIPCVIGTKYATKVLKDGDRVEVDANKGIVRKL